MLPQNLKKESKKKSEKKMIPMIICEYFKMLHLSHSEEAAETIGEHL